MFIIMNDAARLKTSARSLALDSYIERMVAMVGNESKEKTMKILRKAPQDFVIQLYKAVSDCDPAVGWASDTFLETNNQLESSPTRSARGVLNSRRRKQAPGKKG